MERTLAKKGQRLEVTTSAQDAANAELSLVNIDCVTCAGIENALKQMEGVRDVHVNAATDKVHVSYEQSRTRIGPVVERIEELGYRVGRETLNIQVRGMHCASCVAAMEDSLRRTPGVLEATVSPATGTATVEYLPSLADFRAIKDHLRLRCRSCSTRGSV